MCFLRNAADDTLENAANQFSLKNLRISFLGRIFSLLLMLCFFLQLQRRDWSDAKCSQLFPGHKALIDQKIEFHPY